jgi:hypothetical protein
MKGTFTPTYRVKVPFMTVVFEVGAPSSRSSRRPAHHADAPASRGRTGTSRGCAGLHADALPISPAWYGISPAGILNGRTF